MRHVDDVREDEVAPRPEREHLEDADHVVDRRVVGSLLVAVVETVDTEQEHPKRQSRDEEDDLPCGHHGVRAGGRRGDCKSDRVGDDDAHHVRGEEQAAHEPSASMKALAKALPLCRAGRFDRGDVALRLDGVLRNRVHNPPRNVPSLEPERFP